MSERVHIIILTDDRLWKSIASDAVTFAMLAALTGFGVMLGSSAMQWTGAIIWFAWLVGKTVAKTKSSRMTVAEARAKLDALEAGE